MKRLLSVILVLVLAFALVACGKDDGDTPKADVKKYKIGVIYTANSAFWTGVGDGAQAKADELNATGKYKITTYATGPAESGTAAQLTLFEDFISQGYDGIVVAVSDPAVLTPVINKAMDQGILVVTMDTDAPESKRIAFVGTDNYNYGFFMGQECARLMNNTGKLIMFGAFPETLGQSLRMKGIKDALKDTDVEIIEDIFTGTVDLLQMVEDAFVAWPDYDCCCMTYAAGENIATAMRAKGWSKADKKSVLADDLDGIILAIKDGTCDESLVQGQFNWGYVGTQILVDILDGTKKIEDYAGDNWFVETEAFVCDASNVEEKYPNVKPAS